VCSRAAWPTPYGYGGAIAIVAGLTAASGLWVLHDMS
jgi:hypothetical protein